MRSETSRWHNHNSAVPAAVMATAQQVESFDFRPVYLKLPNLYLRGDCFYCDDNRITFHNSSRRLLLLRAFLAAPNYQLNREQILAVVYGESQLQRRSPRYAECVNINALRLLSDTRRQLYVAFASQYRGFDWLYFNKGEKKWKLLRVRDNYVLTQVNARVLPAPPQYDPSTRHNDWH